MRFNVPSAALNAAEAAQKQLTQTPPAIVQKETATQHVKALKERFTQALLSVAENRMVIYKVLVDLKEHFHEYGFKSSAAAVEHVCQRSKAWSNKFCADIESEAGISDSESEVLEQPANTVATSTDKSDKKELAALKKVEQAREEEPERPAVHSADEVKREKSKPHNNGQNGKPKYQLALWGELEISLGRSLNRADELNRMCPNPTLHSQFLAVTKSCMALLAKWRESVK